MLLLDTLVERKIQDAIAAGEFDDLPGAGKPLDLDDDALVPEALRVAYRILRNAGFLPRELEERRELADAAALLRCAADDPGRRRAALRMALLAARLESEGRSLPLDYRERVAERMGVRTRAEDCVSDPAVGQAGIGRCSLKYSTPRITR